MAAGAGVSAADEAQEQRAALNSNMAAVAGTSAEDEAQEQCLFTDRLRLASRQVHSISDALTNSKLLIAFTAKERYGVALGYFWHVFRAIEAHCLAQQATPGLAPLAALLPRVSRTAAFEADLTYLLGLQWQAKCVAPPAVITYLAHLDAIARNDPALLLAHVYTQHSAILAGGQMIRRMARKAMQLPEGYGTKAFEFDPEESPNRLRNEWRAAVNEAAAGLSAEQQAALIQEHNTVFAFNNAIVGGFRVSWLDWPTAFARTVPLKIQIALAVGVALSAYVVGRAWAAWRA